MGYEAVVVAVGVDERHGERVELPIGAMEACKAAGKEQMQRLLLNYEKLRRRCLCELRCPGYKLRVCITSESHKLKVPQTLFSGQQSKKKKHKMSNIQRSGFLQRRCHDRQNEIAKEENI